MIISLGDSPVHDDPGGKMPVDVLEPSEHLGDAWQEVVIELLRVNISK